MTASPGDFKGSIGPIVRMGYAEFVLVLGEAQIDGRAEGVVGKLRITGTSEKCDVAARLRGRSCEGSSTEDQEN